MPSLEEGDLHQRAVLWAAVGYDAYGRPKVDDPEEIDVRWEIGYREVMDENGHTIALDGEAVVTRRIKVGSLMWHGYLSDAPDSTNFVNEDNPLMVVRTYWEIPDIKGRNIRRSVGLQWYKDKLPATTGV